MLLKCTKRVMERGKKTCCSRDNNDRHHSDLRPLCVTVPFLRNGAIAGHHNAGDPDPGHCHQYLHADGKKEGDKKR